MPEILFIGDDVVGDRYWTPGGYKVKFRPRADGSRREEILFRTYEEFDSAIRRQFLSKADWNKVKVKNKSK